PEAGCAVSTAGADAQVAEFYQFAGALHYDLDRRRRGAAPTGLLWHCLRHGVSAGRQTIETKIAVRVGEARTGEVGRACHGELPARNARLAKVLDAIGRAVIEFDHAQAGAAGLHGDDLALVHAIAAGIYRGPAIRHVVSLVLAVGRDALAAGHGRIGIAIIR